MITIIIGKRTDAFTKTLDKVLSSLDKDISIERKTLSINSVQNFFDEIKTPSLFGEKNAFVISNIFDDEELKTLFIDSVAELADAPHDLILTAETILAADMKKIEPFATVHKVTEKEFKGKSFDPFVLANAFATGDKKKTWIAFSEVTTNGDEMEPVHGMIWWKLKSMMGKRGIFSESQMKDIARELVSVYHESRLGGLGMRERLEKFFLTLPSVK